MAYTTMEDMINPQVMADMLPGKIESKIVVTPFARVDVTLEGTPGDTITVPKYEYIGDAEDLAEGESATAASLTTTSQTVTVKKAVKMVQITDEAKLSGYGDPYSEAVNQLAKAIAAKVDADAMAALLDTSSVTLTYDGSASEISYEGIVDAIDVFGEELNTEKVMFINPAQVGALRKDENFISADKYGAGVNTVVTGEVGRIANTRIVPTKKVVISEGTAACPIVKLTSDDETEDETAALTIYLKRGVNLETDRDVAAKLDVVSVDEHYAVALTDATKVVLATFAATAAA